MPLSVLGMMLLAGCSGPQWSFVASASEGLIIDGGYSYDGRLVRRAGESHVEIRLNDETNTGLVTAQVLDVDGRRYRVTFDEFFGTPEAQGGGVHQGFYEHGDTGNGTTELPKFWAYVAAWGNASVTRDGSPLRDPTTLADHFTGHLMVSQGKVRDPSTFQVLKRDGSCCYDPAVPTDAKLASDAGAQVVLQIKTRSGSFFLHFEFEDVMITTNIA